MSAIMKEANILKILLLGIAGISFMIIFMLGFRKWFIATFMVIVVCAFMILSGLTDRMPAYQALIFVITTFLITWGIQEFSLKMFSLTLFPERAEIASNIVTVLIVSLIIVVIATIYSLRSLRRSIY